MARTSDAALHERIVVGLSGAFFAILQTVGFAGVRMDDAYITYRYGENLARGRGLVFNPGERLLGTSAPGHALIAAALHALVGHDALPSAMSALGSVAWTAQAGLIYALVRPLLGRTAASVAALGVAAGAAQSYAVVPLETNLVAALVLGSTVLGFRRRWWLSGLTMGAAVVVRADAVLAAAPLAALAAHDLRWRAWKPAATFAAPVLSWVLAATAYFGTPWPRSLAVKANASTLAAYAAHEAMCPLEDLLALTGLLPMPCGIAFWTLAGCGWWLAVRRSARLLVLPAWGVFHLAAYLALRPDVAFVWHLYPAMLVAAVGLLLLVGFGLDRLPKSAAVAGIVASTCVFSWGALVFSVEYPDMVWYGVRDRVDHDLSAYLRANASPGDIVDSEEVGTVAYLTDLAMLDHRGLVTRAERAGLDRAHFHDAHCRALAAIPRLRFLVMSPVEIPFHRCLYGHRPLVGFDGLGADGRVWALWVVDRLAL